MARGVMCMSIGIPTGWVLTNIDSWIPYVPVTSTLSRNVRTAAIYSNCAAPECVLGLHYVPAGAQHVTVNIVRMIHCCACMIIPQILDTLQCKANSPSGRFQQQYRTGVLSSRMSHITLRTFPSVGVASLECQPANFATKTQPYEHTSR